MFGTKQAVHPICSASAFHMTELLQCLAGRHILSHLGRSLNGITEQESIYA